MKRRSRCCVLRRSDLQSDLARVLAALQWPKVLTACRFFVAERSAVGAERTDLGSWLCADRGLFNSPTFDDVKISIPNMGTSVTIDMINPTTPS